MLTQHRRVKAAQSIPGSVRRKPETPVPGRVRGLLLLVALCASGGAAVWAQSTGHSAEPSRMGQLRQALSLNEHGDRQGAMALLDCPLCVALLDLNAKCPHPR